MCSKNTKILKIDDKSLKYAKNLIEGEDLVAFPTETVYGLGALATSDVAVKRIYEAKGRPQDNPLIVHIHKDYDLTKLVYVENDYAYKLMKAFTPGPLTMIYKNKGVVSPAGFVRARYDRDTYPLARRLPKIFKISRFTHRRAERERFEAYQSRYRRARF